MVTNGNINKLFVPCEIALKLKEKGFDEPCFGYYGNKDETMGLLYSNIYNGNPIETSIAVPHEKLLDCYAPLYQQVIDFVNSKGFSLKYGNISLSLLNKQIEECLNKLESIK